MSNPIAKLCGVQSSSSSSSALANTTTLPSVLANLLVCPVCYDYILPPILQCKSGHLLCYNCRPKVTYCPVCRCPLLGDIRNLAVEEIASSAIFPCKYIATGCNVSVLHRERGEHEDTCEFRPYSCPYPGIPCTWEGSLEAVMPHLMKSHKCIKTVQGAAIEFLATDINLSAAVDWVMIQSCFGHHFMLFLEKLEELGLYQFYASVVLIGSCKQADNFVYHLELKGHKQRLIWEATPRSIQARIASGNLAAGSLAFGMEAAEVFANNGNLSINVTISMV